MSFRNLKKLRHYEDSVMSTGLHTLSRKSEGDYIKLSGDLVSFLFSATLYSTLLHVELGKNFVGRIRKVH